MAIADAVNIDFRGHIEETIQQDGTVVRHIDRSIHILREIFLVVNYLHSATAQNIGRSNHQRKTDASAHFQCLALVARRAVGWLPESQRFDQLLKPLAILRQID